MRVGGSLSPVRNPELSSGPHQPPSCPYLHVWDGKEYKIENNLLGASNTLNKTDGDLLDYHIIDLTPKPENGYYKFMISELGNDYGIFDQLILFMIDNPSGGKLFLDNSLKAYSISKYHNPSRAYDNMGNDITHLVVNDDELYYYSGKPGYFIVEFDSLLAYDAIKTDHDGGAISDPPIKGSTTPSVKTADLNDVIHNCLYIYVDNNGEWLPVDTINGLAFNRRNFYTSLRDYINKDGTLKVKYEWTLEYLIDNVTYAETQEQLDPPIKIPLKSAVNSAGSDITASLDNNDESRLFLLSGKEISFSFAAPIDVKTEDKVFVLAVTGRYSSDFTSIVRDADAKKADTTLLPINFAFDQNYPNPFNPATTFKFALPQEAYVTLDIYDILGRKIETLINANYEAGYHSISWSSKDLSSGVYFAKFRAGDFKETRKVVIVK